MTTEKAKTIAAGPEPFVSADEAAKFLSVKRRYVLELARRGIHGAYALGTGSQRKLWVFRLSELATAVAGNLVASKSR
jgi:excisionase family DNA binding protein